MPDETAVPVMSPAELAETWVAIDEWVAARGVNEYDPLFRCADTTTAETIAKVLNQRDAALSAALDENQRLRVRVAEAVACTECDA